jgi:hypothetical protein
MTIINNKIVSIDTTVPAITIGQVMLSADRRSTETKKLTDAERIRRVVLPAGHWGELGATLNGTTSQSLTDVLRTAMQALGNEKLKDALASDPLARTMELSEFTVPALLAWSAETAGGRGAITFTRDQVESWFKDSNTRIALAAKHEGKSNLAALLSFVGQRFATLAAKNHGLKDIADVEKLTALIHPSDLEGESESAALVTEIMARLEHITKQLTAKAAEATISMDDL